MPEKRKEVNLSPVEKLGWNCPECGHYHDNVKNGPEDFVPDYVGCVICGNKFRVKNGDEL